MAFVKKGRVKPRTVVRGPTTHQLWHFAAHVKGLSREFGLCYSCGGKIELPPRSAHSAIACRLPPLNPDTLLETGENDAGAAPVYRELPAEASSLRCRVPGWCPRWR